MNQFLCESDQLVVYVIGREGNTIPTPITTTTLLPSLPRWGEGGSSGPDITVVVALTGS